MTEIVRRRAIVSGVVQGVGFRWSAREQALRLELAGFARNRADATVELEAQGEPRAVDEFVAWLSHGPAGASVTDVKITSVEVTGARDFEVG